MNWRALSKLIILMKHLKLSRGRLMHRRLTGNGSPRKLNDLLMFKSPAFSARRLLDAVLMLVSCFVLLLCSISPGHAADDFLDPVVVNKSTATEKPGEIDVRYKV